MRLKADEGLWIIPSQGIQTIGLKFAVDLIYLDGHRRVIKVAESFGTFRISPIRLNCSSVLELPTRTIFSSQTQIGDELVICYQPEKMERYLDQQSNSQESKGDIGHETRRRIRKTSGRRYTFR